MRVEALMNNLALDDRDVQRVELSTLLCELVAGDVPRKPFENFNISPHYRDSVPKPIKKVFAG